MKNSFIHTNLRPIGRLGLLALAVLATGAIDMRAQTQGLPERVRALNNGILQLHGRTRGAVPGAIASLRSEAAPLFQERAAAMSELIRRHPAQALSLAFSQEAAQELARRFPESAALLETEGEWEGSAEYVVADDESLQTAATFINISTAEGKLDVHVADQDPVNLKCGDRLHVRGIRLGGDVAASEALTIAAAAVPCGPTGVQNTVVLLVTFPGVTPPAISTADVANAFFGTAGRSVDSFWREASYNRASATGNVYGWYTLPQLYTCDQYSQMRDAAIRAADADVNFANYTRIFVLFPNPGSCSYAGISYVGCSPVATGDGTVTVSSSWMVANYFTSNDQGVKLAIHEGGHALGLMHSRTRDFGADVVGALGVSGTVSEYGDIHSTMGSWNFGHYNVEQKLKLGWLSAANVPVVQSPGSFTILPTEVSGAGIQGIQVQRGTGNNAYLWVEFRQPVGWYDSTLNSQVFSGALVHYRDTLTSSYTDLLDFTRSSYTFTDPSLPAGSTWTDPYTNVSLTVNSASSNGLNVSVNYGALPCTRSAPTVTMSPSNPSVYAGNSVNYTVSVTNRDSTSCPATTFNLSSDAPTWPTSISLPSVTVNPGQTTSVTVSKSVPTGTSPSTYGVTTTASDGTRSQAGNANCTVMATTTTPTTTTNLSASLTVSQPTLGKGSNPNLTFTVVVVNGSLAASGASVTFTIQRPNGATAQQTVTADYTGKATWSYKPPQNGTYTVTARATYMGQTVSTSSSTFTIQ